MNRCKWCNLNNPKYIDYHDNEWGVLNLEDTYLLEMLILEFTSIHISSPLVVNISSILLFVLYLAIYIYTSSH